MVLEGLMALEIHLGGRTATELIGSGDLLMVPDRRAEEMVDHTDVWRVLAPVRVGVLDEGFLERVRAWPPLTRALMRRVSHRVNEVDALRAISCHPRLEVRLVLLLWHLGSRWGRVQPSGIRLTLPLTHRLLGQLVGAERPSISHALRRLDRCGLVSGGAGDLHLHGTMQDHLDVLAERADPRQRQVTAGSAE
jgi:CRP/FNR family cyclic AMP-dependent transcriptional regulator